MTNIRHPAKSMGAQWRGRNGGPMIDPITTAPFISDPPVVGKGDPRPCDFWLDEFNPSRSVGLNLESR